jgi:SET domain
MKKKPSRGRGDRSTGIDRLITVSHITMKKSISNARFTDKPRDRFLGKKPSKQTRVVSIVNSLTKDPSTKYTLIGVAIVLLSILYGHITKETELLNNSLQSFLSLSCEIGVCMKGLVNAVDRKLVAARRLEKGWKLFEVPRSMQIWTLDALRDPFVKKNLLGARHLKTQQPLASEAFLAAHLAEQRSAKSHRNHDSDAIKHKLRDMYLGLLPTYDDFKLHHPVLFDLRKLSSKFGSNSYFYFLVSRRKAEIQSEYKAFSNVSSIFQEKITFKDYVAARLSVQTRRFRSTPLDEMDASPEELLLYKKHLGIDLREGSTAAVALMDALNAHHGRHNVQYKYIAESKKFYLYAAKDIPAGEELYISFGDRAE